MPYKINRYNGSLIATVQDGTINSSLDIKLIGKNYAGFGEAQNENFVWLLENFAGSSAPAKPVVGQLWYDTLNKQLKVYSGAGFKSTAGVEISASQPAIASDGDLWFNSATKQLFVYSSTISGYRLVGPQQSTGKGDTLLESGLLSDGVNSFAVIKILVDGKLVGIISNDEFTPVPSILSDTNVNLFPIIKKGITISGASTLGATPDYTLWGTVSNSLALAGTPAAEYVQRSTADFTNLVKFSDSGFSVGHLQPLSVSINNSAAEVQLNSAAVPLHINATDINNDVSTVLSVSSGQVLPGTSRNVSLGSASLKFKEVHASSFFGNSSSSSKLFVNDGIPGVNDFVVAAVAPAAYTIASRDAAGDISANTFKGTATSALGLVVNQVNVPAAGFVQISSPIFSDVNTPVTLSDVGIQFGTTKKFGISVESGELAFSSTTHIPLVIAGSDILPGNPVTGLEPQDPQFRNNIGSNTNRFNTIYAKNVVAQTFTGTLVGGKAENAVLADYATQAIGLKTYNGSISDERNVINNFAPPGNVQNVIDTVPVRISGDLGPTIFSNIVGNASTVTDGVYLSNEQTITGSKTFTSPVIGTGGFVGNLLGNVTATQITASTTISASGGFIGNLNGTATNAASAVTVTGANQSAITSVGTLTSLTMAAQSRILPQVDGSVDIGSTNLKFGNIYGTLIGTATRSTNADRADIASTITGQANSATTRATPNNDAETIVLRDSSGNFSAHIMNGTATSAQYADLAEKYLTDNNYEPGTVVSVGGAKEVTQCQPGDYALGVISTNPAYMMNSLLEGGQYVALTGRVPVKVVGKVRKGDRLVPTFNGFAKVQTSKAENVFAIALESSDDFGEKVIEAVVK